MSYKESIAENEALKKERKSGLAAMFKTGKVPAGKDDDDDDMADNAGFINSNAKGGKADYQDDEDNEDQDEEVQLRKQISGNDDENEEDNSPAPVAHTAKEPERTDGEISPEAYNKQLREENAELRSRFDQDRLERQELMQELRKGNQQRQPEHEPDPDVPWVEKPQLDQYKREVENTSRAVQSMLLSQERGIFDRDIKEIVAQHPQFKEYYNDQHLDNVWREYAKNPNAFAPGNGGNPFGQKWKEGLMAGFKQRDYDRISSIKAETKAKADELDKKRREKSAENNKNLGKVPRSGTAYQEPAAKPLDSKRRDFKDKSLRGEMLRHMAQGG